MSTEEPLEPDWKIHETAPLLFFGLPGNAGRADLRRRYAALIRWYRPESHSVEFQMIRRAYELADGTLDSQSGEVSELESIDGSKAAKTIAIQRHSAFNPPRGESCQATLPTDLQARIVSTARNVASDRFYSASSAMLHQFFCSVPSDAFMECYQQIAPFVEHDDVFRPPTCRVQFLLFFLQYACWTLPESWIDEQACFLERNADLIEESAEYDFLLRLLDYRDFCRRHDDDYAQAVLQPLHSIILEFYKRPWKEGCHYFQEAVRLLLKNQSILDASLQYSHRRFIRAQLEFWELLTARIAADLYSGAPRVLAAPHFVDSVQWKSFIAASGKKLTRHPVFRRNRRTVYTQKVSRSLLQVAFGAFLGLMLLLTLLGFLTVMGALFPAFEILWEVLVQQFSLAVCFFPAAGGIWWLFRLEVFHRYGNPDIEAQQFSLKDMQTLYSDCYRKELLQLLQGLEVTPRDFLSYFQTQPHSIERDWSQTSEFVFALLHVAVADPRFVWLETALPFEMQHASC